MLIPLIQISNSRNQGIYPLLLLKHTMCPHMNHFLISNQTKMITILIIIFRIHHRLSSNLHLSSIILISFISIIIQPSISKHKPPSIRTIPNRNLFPKQPFNNFFPHIIFRRLNITNMLFSLIKRRRRHIFS